MPANPIQNVPLQPLARRGMQASDPNAATNAIAALLGSAGRGGNPGVSPGQPADFSQFNQGFDNIQRRRERAQELEEREKDRQFQADQSAANRAHAETMALRQEVWAERQAAIQADAQMEFRARDMLGTALSAQMQQALVDSDIEGFARYSTALQDLYTKPLQAFVNAGRQGKVAEEASLPGEARGRRTLGQGGGGQGGMVSSPGAYAAGAATSPNTLVGSPSAARDAMGLVATIAPAIHGQLVKRATDEAFQVWMAKLDLGLDTQREAIEAKAAALTPLSQALGEQLAINTALNPAAMQDLGAFAGEFDRTLANPEFQLMLMLRDQSRAAGGRAAPGILPHDLAGSTLEALRPEIEKSYYAARDAMQRLSVMKDVKPEALDKDTLRVYQRLQSVGQPTAPRVLMGYGGTNVSGPGRGWQEAVKSDEFQNGNAIMSGYLAAEAAKHNFGGWTNKTETQVTEALRSYLTLVGKDLGTVERGQESAYLNRKINEWTKTDPLGQTFGQLVEGNYDFLDPKFAEAVRRDDVHAVQDYIFGPTVGPPAALKDPNAEAKQWMQGWDNWMNEIGNADVSLPPAQNPVPPPAPPPQTPLWQQYEDQLPPSIGQ